MVNFVYAIGDRATGECVLVDPAYAVGDLVDIVERRRHERDRRARHPLPRRPRRRSMMGYPIAGVAALLERVDARSTSSRRGAVGAATTGVAEADLVAHDSGDVVTVGDDRRSSCSTRPATRRAASASSSTAGWSPATRCSSTGAAAPTCPAATRSRWSTACAVSPRSRRHDPVPRPPLLVGEQATMGAVKQSNSCSTACSDAVRSAFGLAGDDDRLSRDELAVGRIVGVRGHRARRASRRTSWRR